MKTIVVAVVIVFGFMALGLICVNFFQAETVAQLREQNGLLRMHTRHQWTVCKYLEKVNRSYSNMFEDLTYSLGLDAKPTIGSICGTEVFRDGMDYYR